MQSFMTSGVMVTEPNRLCPSFAVMGRVVSLHNAFIEVLLPNISKDDFI